MKSVHKTKSYFLKKMLNILGVSSLGLMVSCAKYGVEVNTIDMQLKGRVVSSDSLIPIEGLKVKVSYSFNDAVSFSNINGDFNLNAAIEEFNSKILLRIEDVDGDLNGKFRTKDTTLVLTEEEMSKGLKENIDIKLKKDE